MRIGITSLALLVSIVAFAVANTEETPEDKKTEETTPEETNQGDEDDEDTPLLVECGTTKGPFTIELEPHWSPSGVHRFIELVEDGFFDGSSFFRTVEGFLVQFGIPADPKKAEEWRHRGEIRDDPKRPDIGEGIMGRDGSFPKGGISFAGNGQNSRTTQLFVTYEDGMVGENPWETQIGVIVSGMENIESFYSGYGDMKEFNEGGVDAMKLEEEGISYVEENFPKLDRFTSCKVVSESEDWITMPKPASARFVNNSGKEVHLFWVAPDDEHVHQATISEGDMIDQDTYTGHTFIIKESLDGSAEILAKGSIEKDKHEYVFDGASDEF